MEDIDIDGVIHAECRDERNRDWLGLVIQDLHLEDLKLRDAPTAELPRPRKTVVTLRLLEDQNPGLGVFS